MTRETQAPWPRFRADGMTEKRSPTAFFTNPDTIMNSDRSVVGPLRMGTAPGTGPNGALRNGGSSDFGLDRITPRKFDPIGTAKERYAEDQAATLVSRELRGSSRRRED